MLGTIFACDDTSKKKLSREVCQEAFYQGKSLMECMLKTILLVDLNTNHAHGEFLNLS
jgi:hypothetical protein